MSQLTKAFQNSRRNMAARAVKPSGNVVLKVKEFTAKTVKGEVMNGAAAGTEIEVLVPQNGDKWGKSVGIKEFTKKGHKSFVDVEKGGTIRIEKLKEGKDGVYESRWMKTFNGVPAEGHEVIYDAVAQFRSEKSRDGADKPRLYLQVIYPEENKQATNLDELRTEIAAAFSAKNGVYIFFEDEGRVGSFSYSRGGEKVDDVWVWNDAAEAADAVIASFGDDLPLIEKALSQKAFSVVPSSRLMIGGDTKEGILNAIQEAQEKGEDARISTIDPKTFNVTELGLRVQYALNDRTEEGALPKDAADRLKARFLEVAGEEAKAAFHANGWRGVSTEDMRRFFDAVGVQLGDHPEAGWSRQNILLKNGVAIKTFGMDSGMPYPNVPACKEAIAAFRTELREAIRAVNDAPAVTAAAAKAETPAPAPAAPAPEADIDDLDALLDGVQDADMGA
ncbi:MAG: hypothetical protein KC466_18085 [Myxococcales bacterium]|nr:hypothetical protein [Myxococcales bacterium]